MPNVPNRSASFSKLDPAKSNVDCVLKIPYVASFFSEACRFSSMNVARSGCGPGNVDCAGCDGIVNVSDGVNFSL